MIRDRRQRYQRESARAANHTTDALNRPTVATYNQHLLTALLIAAATTLLVFIIIPVAWHGRLSDIDLLVTLSIQQELHGSGVLVSLATWATAMGNNLTLWIVVLTTTGCLIACRAWHAALHLTIVTGLGALLTRAIKLTVDRPRPPAVLHFVNAYGPSFPSGHATNSAFVFGTLALIASHAPVSAQWRRAIGVAAVLLIVVVGLSRVVLCVHWSSDVLSGWIIGTSWALLGARVAALSRP